MSAPLATQEWTAVSEPVPKTVMIEVVVKVEYASVSPDILV